MNNRKIDQAIDEGFQKRVEEFMKDYKALTDKYKVDYTQFPMYIPDQKGGFITVIQNQPIDLNLQELNKSFIAKDAKENP